MKTTGGDNQVLVCNEEDQRDKSFKSFNDGLVELVDAQRLKEQREDFEIVEDEHCYY